MSEFMFKLMLFIIGPARPYIVIAMDFIIIFVNLKNFIKYRKKEWYTRKNKVITFVLIGLAFVSLALLIVGL
jgi:hypothetical protein